MSIENVSYEQFKDHVDERHKSGNPFSADEISGMNTDQYHAVLNHVADMQRGAPETAMNHAQRILGGGVQGDALEHVGDLTHRMNEEYGTDQGGFYRSEYVKPKVEVQLRHLTSGYGYDREAKENLHNNRSDWESRGKPVPSDVDVWDSLETYADAHQALPVYHEPGYHARSAAVSVGRRNTPKAVEHLQALKSLVDDNDRYQQAMSREGSVAWLKSQESDE